jgi:uncharacterized cupredoxin-like copper-binding protein
MAGPEKSVKVSAQLSTFKRACIMKRTLSLLAFCVLPALVLASGNHTGGHGAAAHGGSGHAASITDHAATAVGRPGDSASVTRSIDVMMDDNFRFTPSQIKVHAGETVRFRIKNEGKIPHEMVIGSMKELKAHAAEMRKMPGMQHAEPNMITLAPGNSGDLVWKFDQLGTVDFACLIPGHLEAGMAGQVKID